MTVWAVVVESTVSRADVRIGQPMVDVQLGEELVELVLRRETENNCSIYIYSNQPVVFRDGEYYVRQKNFVDFLAELAKQDGRFRLVVPCGAATDAQMAEWMPIELPSKVVHVRYYESHAGALVSSLRNAVTVRALVRRDLSGGGRVLVAGPGPNSFLFWLSLMLPRTAKYAFFIRGDTLKTVQNIFRGKWIYPGAVMLVRLFQARIRRLLARRRAMVFVYGDKLKELYSADEYLVESIAPLIEEGFSRVDLRPVIVPSEPLKILFVGRLSEEKNVMALLDAVRSVAEKGIVLNLRIVGYGPLEQQVRDYIVDHGLEGYCEYVGYLAHGEALVREYDLNDVLCLPSKTEGVPRVVVEAFARGMPVLSTPVGSIPHLFPDEIRFIEGTHVQAIEQGLRWASANRAELSKLGMAGQRKVAAFGISANADRVRRALIGFGCQAAVDIKDTERAG